MHPVTGVPILEEGGKKDAGKAVGAKNEAIKEGEEGDESDEEDDEDEGDQNPIAVEGELNAPRLQILSHPTIARQQRRE